MKQNNVDDLRIYNDLLADCEGTLLMVQTRLEVLRRDKQRLSELGDSVFIGLRNFVARYDSDRRQQVAPKSLIQNGVGEIDREEPTIYKSFYTSKYEPYLSESHHGVGGLAARSHRKPTLPQGSKRISQREAKEIPSSLAGNTLSGNERHFRDADPFMIDSKISPPLHIEAQRLLEWEKRGVPRPVSGSRRAAVSWNTAANEALVRLVQEIGLANNVVRETKGASLETAPALGAIQMCRSLPPEQQWEFITDVLEQLGNGVGTILVPRPGEEQAWKQVHTNPCPLSVNEVTLHFKNAIERRSSIDDFTPDEDKTILKCVTDQSPRSVRASCDRFLGFAQPAALRALESCGGGANLVEVISPTETRLRRGVNCWTAVAILLGTNRSGFSCLQRFQRALRKGYWVDKGIQQPHGNTLELRQLKGVVCEALRREFPSSFKEGSCCCPVIPNPSTNSYVALSPHAISLSWNQMVLSTARTHGFLTVAEAAQALGMFDSFSLSHPGRPVMSSVAVLSFIAAAHYFDVVMHDSSDYKDSLVRVDECLRRAGAVLGEQGGHWETDHRPYMGFAGGFSQGLAMLDYPAVGYMLATIRYNTQEEYALRVALRKDNLSVDDARRFIEQHGTKRRVASEPKLHIQCLPTTTLRYLGTGVRRKRGAGATQAKTSSVFGHISQRLQQHLL